MAFPATLLDVTVELALGADLTEFPSLWVWTDITAYLHEPAGVVISRGRPDEFATAPPSRIALTLNNADGRFCPKNPEGAYYGQINRNTPLRVRIDPGSGNVTRAVGFVDQWPVVWGDKSLSVSLAPVTASGPLRRLGQGAAQRSALYRVHALAPYASASSVVGYWPGEDESGSTSIASGIGGRAAVLSGGVENFAADSDIAGSDPLMTLAPGVSFVGYCDSYVSTGETAIRAIFKVPAAPSGSVELLRWWTSGSYTIWTVELVPGAPDRLFLRAYNASGVEQLGGGGANMEDNGAGVTMYGKQLYLAVDLVETGGAINWTITVYDYFAYNQSYTGSTDNGSEAAATVGVLEAIGSHNHSAAADGITLGHLAVATDTNYGAGAAGATGFAGESVTIRFADLTGELDVSGLVSNVPPVNMRTYVGASSETDVVGLFRELETVEQGVLYDGAIGTLDLLVRSDRYNRAVALTLNHAAGEVDWLAPTDDDQQIRNDITVSRPGGSQFRAFDSAHIAANGSYAATVDALLFEDSQLRDDATWRLHLGTVDELRYPTVGLCLTRQTSKIADWLACDIGSRIQILNPPDGLPPDTIDLHIEGYTEYLRSKDWRVELNTSPASPWQVFEIEDSSLGRLDTDGSELLCAYDSTATSLLLAQTGTPKYDPWPTAWSTTAEPYDLHIAGEKVTVTAMAAPAPSLVGAGTAVHADNATVTPGIHASAVKGDLVLVFAAIRNTSATVNNPAGYTVLMGDGNVGLFGKIHTGSESSPSVTFTGGAAGDSTSAQTATFRGFQLSTAFLTNLSNASAQNIDLPAFFPPQGHLLVLWLAWKQDDWTSAADLFAGVTEIAEFTTTTGNDQGMVWNYQIQTIPAAFGGGTWAITGGAAAISKSYVVAVPGDVQAATVTRSANGVSKSHTAGTAVSLYKPAVLAL